VRLLGIDLLIRNRRRGHTAPTRRTRQCVLRNVGAGADYLEFKTIVVPARDDARLLLSPSAAKQFARDFSDATVRDGVELFRAIRFLAQRMNEASAKWLSAYALSSTKFNYLAVLYARRRTGLSARELGTSVRTSSGTVTTMLDSLERERLIARKRHPGDARCIIIRLTPKGERLYRAAAEAQHAGIAAAVEALGTERMHALVQLSVDAGNALHDASALPSEAMRA